MNWQNFYKYIRPVIPLGIGLGLLLTGCIAVPINPQGMADQSTTNQSNNVSIGTEKVIRAETLYGAVTFSEVADQAAAIFVGKVTRISPAQWNQDSGEYWSDTEDRSTMASFVISHIEVDVVQTIAVSITLEPQIKLPVLSEGYVVDENNNVIEEKERAHDLAADDQAVFFIRPTDLAWRGGARPVLYLMGHPRQSYFKLGEDGLYHGELLEGAFTLDELIKRIEEERATPPQ